MTVVDYGSRGRLGLLLPSGNQAAEQQFRALLPTGVSLHTTRLKLAGGGDAALLAMTEHLESAASLLADCGVDLIVFHCTAVSTYDAALEQSLIERIARASGRPATATSRALLAGLRALGARRVVAISPYVEAVDRREAAFLEGAGIEVLRTRGLGLDNADAMMAVTPERWYELVLEQRHPDADAYLLSCTTVRTLEVVQSLEDELGRPVLTSNSATAWHAMRILGVGDRLQGTGCLLAQH